MYNIFCMHQMFLLQNSDGPLALCFVSNLGISCKSQAMHHGVGENPTRGHNAQVNSLKDDHVPLWLCNTAMAMAHL